MRVLVTGAAGDLARAWLACVPTHHDVHAFTRDQLDIGDHHAVLATVGAVEPDVVLNLAAYTDVDGNETDTERAFRDNALGPQSLAIAAGAVGAVLLHVSTDYVFDGEKDTAYDEADEPRPISTYGRAKLLGERLVRAALREHVIVRTGYVYGGGSDHLSRQLAKLRAGEPAAGLQDRVGSPTNVRHLAERLLPLVLAGRWGTYHLAGPEPASWFAALERCRALAGFDPPVEPQRAATLDLPAPRPVQSALTTVLVGQLGVPPMPSLDEGLADAIARAASEG
ncbi:MAG TPA: NAD(P)-dependent oxidoreductase [Actinomycetota bacterium]|nr:NAD(P)-dependent oxidoreductase [Actinomycetota bacterium]